MDEREGRALLKARFEAAGFRIRVDHTFVEEGVSIRLDGFDPAARVGYEYITTEAGDRADVSPAEIASLEERMKRGEVFVLLLDEREAPTREILDFAATRFLEAVLAKGRGAKPTPKKRTATKGTPKKGAAKKRTAKKSAAKKRAAKKRTAKKGTATKRTATKRAPKKTRRGGRR